MNKFLLTIVSPFILSSLFAQTYCGSSRYTDTVFSAVTTTSNVVYGSNLDLNGNAVSLQMDIYQPTGDVATIRPLIIFAHGGSFIGGDKTNADEVAFATAFAKRGYVTASINYRLGMGFPINQTGAMSAVWRAVQDMKAAVRFFRKDAATTNTYKIDPDYVFIGGYSAGAFMAIHYAYLNNPNDIPSGIDTLTLGGMQGNSGNPGYCTNINGVISFSGAIGDTCWIRPGVVPMVSAQGNNDNTVPYCSNMLSVSGFPIMDVHGSGTMNIRFNHLGIYNPFHTYYGEDHCAPIGTCAGAAANIDTSIALASKFVYHQLGCTSTSTFYTNTPHCLTNLTNTTSSCGSISYTPAPCVTNNGVNEIVLSNENVSLYPNPASENITLTMKEVKGNKFSGEIHDITGRVVSRFNFSDKTYLIKRNEVQSGIYFLKITSDANEVFVSKILFAE